MKQWKPKDIVALVVVVGAISLLWQGIDTVVGWSLIAIVAGYYGIEVPALIKVIKNSKTTKGE